MTKLLKRCWMGLAFLIISTAIISSAFRTLTPFATQYKTHLESHLSHLLGRPVAIKSMETDWYWFRPVIKLEEVRVQDGLKLDKLLVGINLFSSLFHWQLRPGILVIDDLELTLYQKGKTWQIEGYRSDKKILDEDSYKAALALILSQQKIILKNLSANIHLNDGGFIPVQHLNLRISNRNEHYKLKGDGLLQQQKVTKFSIAALFNIEDLDIKTAKGHLFLSLQNFILSQWQSLIPQEFVKFADGSSNLDLWGDVKEGKFKNIQANLDFQNLLLENPTTAKKEAISHFQMNLAWKPEALGWQLSGDKIHLNFANDNWPENSFTLHFDKTKKTYFLYLNHFALDILKKTPLQYVDLFKPLIALAPSGHLSNTQLEIKNNKLDSFLTTFEELSFSLPKLKSRVENLKGVFFWTSNEGRLALDSDSPSLQINKRKKILFSKLNAQFNWQKEVEGYDVQLSQLILLHPNLNLKASGQLNKLSDNTKEDLRLKGSLVAENAEYWLQFVPEHGLKVKLRDWLKKDIKRIKNLNAVFNVQGPLKAFPFDKEPGEFEIKTKLEGVDLFFAHNWPLTTDIDGFLTINKRHLEALISKANFNDIPLKEAHLSIADLGLDKEVLLIHSLAEPLANKALNYMRASPLNKKLQALNILTMKGPMHLDLQLEIPLYPQNDTILAVGDIQFNHNEVNVHHSMDDVQLKNLTGSLQFNEKGVLDSNLNALLLESLIDMKIRSVHGVKPYTEVKTRGVANIETLNKKFNLPLFSLMKGSLALESILQLTDDPNDLDKLKVSTTMEGVDISLPAPFGKTAKMQRPLSVQLAFNPAKAANLNINYDNLLSSDLWFLGGKGAFKFQKGEIRFGSGDAIAKKEEGLQLRGDFSEFNLAQWLKTKESMANHCKESPLLQAINLVDIKFSKALIAKENYNNLLFLAEKVAENEWSFHLDEQKIKANLLFNEKTQSLRGQFDRLYLEKAESTAEKSTLNPNDLPNIDFRIHDFHYNNLDLGSIDIKALSKANLWKIDSCKIKSPFYEFNIQGEWQKIKDSDSTNLKVNMQISNLAKTLKLWQISPAVEASRGELRFEGGWQDSLMNFSLKKVKGQMALSLKDGRITNLSPETEEKLGLGKLLSVLSLQTIPRRLKLDFSDLANDGYSFDDFQGSFAIAKGIMTTKDSYIEGPVAYASMKGNLDIAEKKYDVDLKVSPHITASLPVVATIAGGPIAGFATWVASRIINQSMQKISAYTYKISGPWQKPVMEQVSIIKSLKMKG